MADTPYFTPAEFKARYPSDAEVSALEDAEIDAARGIAEEIIEHECHVAFTPRVTTFTISGEWSHALKLPVYKIRAIDSIEIDGNAQDLTGYRFEGGIIYRLRRWPRNVANITVAVEHGYDVPPLRIKDAAMILTYHRAIRGPVEDRATSIPAGDAGGTITLLTPGVRDAVTGIPEVDGTIVAYRRPRPGSIGTVKMVDPAHRYPPYPRWWV